MEHTGFLFPRVLQFQITVTTTPCPHNTQTQMSACEHGEVSVSSVDCTDVSFLVLILHHSYARGNHRRRQWHPTPVPLPGKSHGWRSLVGYSPWAPKEPDTILVTEHRAQCNEKS